MTDFVSGITSFVGVFSDIIGVFTVPPLSYFVILGALGILLSMVARLIPGLRARRRR